MPRSDHRRRKRPASRWLSGLNSLVLILIAIALAFPVAWGSGDEPSYALAVVFLALAVVIWTTRVTGASAGDGGD